MSGVVIDTSVIVRHLVDGDEGLVEALAQASEVHIPLPMWLETVFVLEKVYGVPRVRMVEQLRVILLDERVVSDKELLEAVWDCYVRQPKLSVMDCFVAVFGKFKGLELVSYDRKLSKVFGEM